MPRTKLIHLEDDDLIAFDAEVGRAIGQVRMGVKQIVKIAATINVQRNGDDETEVEWRLVSTDTRKRGWTVERESENPPLPFEREN